MPLRLWRDISPLPVPMKQPSNRSSHILIVGGGVIGLTTAWVLLDRGYRVTIASKDWVNEDERLTSQIAGALWEFPPAVCGQHTDAISLAHSKLWAMTSYHIWDGIASIPALSKQAGIRTMPSDFFFHEPVDGSQTQSKKMKELMASGVRGFYHGADIIEERGLEPSYGAVDAYEIMAPIIDTDQAMVWLTELIESKGANMVTECFNEDLVEIEDELLSRFEADAIVNCTGLAGKVLAGDDTVYPIRGGLIRVINDGKAFPKLNAALTISADAAHTTNEIVFLVPRNDNTLLIGGITEPNEWNLDLTLDSPIIRRMRERCDKFLPGLKDARYDLDRPLVQGLRPFRQRNVRVERELRRTGSRIVHSYGHGGAGWSLSFGCAQDVATLTEEALAGLPARPMQDKPPVKGTETLVS
ncbi:FAD dependent oxidoreductase [Xylariomycetidae sp. FL0641]|nr:FAD dependent oxidoreductase [Xylariomycetidae sp. FL0641]